MAVQAALPPMHFSVAIIGVLIGVVILFFGRKLFWLCVAAAGFALGAEIAPHLIQEPSSILRLVVALVFGVLGALLAIFLQKVAIAVLGFLAGGYLAGAIGAAFFIHSAQFYTIIFLVGGIIGCLVAFPMNGFTAGTGQTQSFSELAFAFKVTPGIILVGLIFAVLMGLIGGLLPAVRASQMPITKALREA